VWPLGRLVADRLSLSGDGAANSAAKVACLVAGMVAGADSIDDMDLLRHGGMGRLFGGVRAPSTLGTFLRRFSFGHVPARCRGGGAVAEPGGARRLLPGADRLAWIDARATHGYAKQGTGRGYIGVKGLNALIATVSTPLRRRCYRECHPTFKPATWSRTEDKPCEPLVAGTSRQPRILRSSPAKSMTACHG
jgi:hypothetical protein